MMSTSPNSAILHYNFENVSSTIVPDISNTGSSGVICGHDRGGAYIHSENVFGRERSVLYLTGGEKGGWLSLPEGILNQDNGFTVSFYAAIHELNTYSTLCSFGEDICFYLSALPHPEDTDYVLLSPGVTNGGRSQEASLPEWVKVRKNVWLHVVMTFDSSLPANGCFYLDGHLVGTFQHRRMNASAMNECAGCYVGYGALSKTAVNLSVAEFIIQQKVIEENEISTLFHVEDNTRLSFEHDALKAFFLKNAVTEEDLTLPVLGIMGCTVEWKSLTPDFVDSEGKINPPSAGCADATATLQACVRWKEHSQTDEYSFTIPAKLPDSELAKMDALAVTFPFPGHITQDLFLPAVGRHGSRLSYASSHPEYLSSDGTIVRPKDAPAEVTLSITALLQDASYEHRVSLTLLPEYGQTKPAIRYHRPISPSSKGKPAALAKALPMYHIQLNDTGILSQNQNRCLDYLLYLDSDRMLYNFRKAFCQDTGNTPPPGGWEEPSGLLRGHSTGHYLSALAFAYSTTCDDAFRTRAEYLIHELRKLQLLSKGDPAAFKTACSPANAAQSLWSTDPSAWGEGFLSAYSPDQFALLEQYTPYATIWAPYYTLHKLLAGFIDCYEQMNNATALECASGIGSWVYHRLSATTAEQRAKMWSMYIAGEYGGMNESLSKLYELTGEKHLLEAAVMFDNPKVFNGLAKGLDTISGIHANQHIPQIIGVMDEYRATGNIDYYETARNFWHLVTNHYLYSIGGVGRGENFKEPDVLAANIEADRNCETCAAYNMLKLTSKLYAYEPNESIYMDYYERAMINQIAASQNPVVTPFAHHGVTYMLPIGPGARREYSNDYEDFTCCHGTGMENHVRYSENIYHMDINNDILYINLYLSSSLCMEDIGLSLTQECAFPAQQSQITLHKSKHMKFMFRIPYWCRESFSVALNGTKAPNEAANSDGYFLIERDFVAGDVITITLPYHLHLCYTPDNYEDMPAASLMYGPLVMTALHDTRDWITLAVPPVLEDAFDIEWCTNGTPILWYDNLKFVPMYEAHNTNYHTYFKIELL